MSEYSIETIRHSTAHLLAAAVLELYPNTKFGIGPVIENGFYYDFDFPKNVSISSEDLLKIEKKMEELRKRDLAFERSEMTIEEAIKFFKKLKQDYKVELLEDLRKFGTTKMEQYDSELSESDFGITIQGKSNFKVSIYKLGDFVDLCRGPHVASTKDLGVFKLEKIAGAYWRGSEKNKMLTRIYGFAFRKKEELDKHLKMIEEAKKRDHRVIGKNLDLFSFHEEGPGFPFFHAKGMVILNEIMNYWREMHKREGYVEIRTPIILNRVLWEKSGHWEHYRENMYFTKIDDVDYAIKPMNCPGGVLVYKTTPKSYRDLPLRVAEIGLVHRHELAGVLHGLFRVRSFTQDDAHIYCLPTQIQDEIKRLIDLILEIYDTFGFKDVRIELSTRPRKSMGSDKMWQTAESALKKALEDKKINYKLNEGEGAFYGPKIDFHICDCVGRTWQCGTIQLDFAMPETLDVTYVARGGKKERPAMIHRTVLGSFERFLGILIEHYAGALPTWLSPVQVKVIPVGQRHIEASEKLVQKLNEEGCRTEVDLLNETVGYKIRKAEKEKVPYMLVIGDKEAKGKKLTVRIRGKKDTEEMDVKKFVERIKKETADKK